MYTKEFTGTLALMLGWPDAEHGQVDMLRQALTHSSAVGGSRETSNERLEWLGDSVLELIVSAWLFRLNPAMREGQMTEVRTKVISTEALARVAVRNRLGEFLIVGRGQDGCRIQPRILASTVEAIVGAAFTVDGLPLAQQVVHRLGIIPR